MITILVAGVAVICIAAGGTLARHAWTKGGVSLTSPGPLEGEPLRRYTIAVLLLLVGIIAAFILVIQSVGAS